MAGATWPRVLGLVVVCVLLSVASLVTLAVVQQNSQRHTPLHLPVIRRAIDAASFFGSDSEQLAADVADKSGTGGNASPITARAPAPNNAKVSKVDSVPQAQPLAKKTDARAARPICTQDKPVTKIVYIKTHKTGSSTLTNIFHRFGEKHSLKMAVPRDNLFYAWPHLAASLIVRSVESLGNVRPPYDILCSAHVRYNREALEQIVPGGKYVTILRSPLTHFSSSWYHWHVWDHIVQAGGPHFEPNEFIADWEKNKRYLRSTDLMLLVNSFMFDLGYDNPTQKNVDDLIKDMSENFGMVLITEHMHESLLLMKRMFCWELEDVVHISLKVATNKPKHVEDPVLAAKRNAQLEKINWADIQLYRHFNRTLWERIALEKDFDIELAELKKEIAMWSQRCKDYVRWEEDAHRVQIEERPDNTYEKRHCHELWLDSKGYSKHLKHLVGYPVDKLECWASFPAKRVLHMVTDHPADDVSVNILAQWSVVSRDVSMALPTPSPPTLPGRLLPQPTGYMSASATGLFALPGFIYNRPQMEQLSPGLIYMALFRFVKGLRGSSTTICNTQLIDTEFLDAWKKMELTARLQTKANDSTLTLEDFLEKPDHYLSLMSDDDLDVRYHLVDRQSYRMGFPRDVHTQGHVMYMMKHLWWFAFIGVAEHVEETMIMYRRTLCWPMDAVVFFDEARWTQSVSHKLSDFYTGKMAVPQMERKIEQLNRYDTMIFRRTNETLWGKIDRQVSYKDEVQLYRKKRAEAKETCAALRSKYGDRWETMAPMFQEAAATDRTALMRCNLMGASLGGTFDFLKLFGEQRHYAMKKMPPAPPPGVEPF